MQKVIVFPCILLGITISALIGEALQGDEPYRVKVRDLKYSGKYNITVYQAVKEQCDSTPDIGAGGIVAKNGVPLGNYFANNGMKFGTKIVIPSLSGDKIWICKDRMNRRYGGDRIDLLIGLKDKIYGQRTAEVYIIK